MRRLPYRGRYPSAARYLMERGIVNRPRQYARNLRWSEGVDIVYTMSVSPNQFARFADSFLLLAYQEAMRYQDEGRWKFAGFDVRLGRLKRGRDIPNLITFQASMHDDPDILVYGPGYEVPQEIFLHDQVRKILELTQRYKELAQRQVPFRVIRLRISIRQPRERTNA